MIPGDLGKGIGGVNLTVHPHPIGTCDAPLPGKNDGIDVEKERKNDGIDVEKERKVGRLDWAASLAESEVLRLFPSRYEDPGIGTGGTDSCATAAARLTPRPLRSTGHHPHGSDMVTNEVGV